MDKTSHALAARLEAGAAALAEFAASLTEKEWQMRLPKDGRKMGVLVHHVASVYPIEIQLAQVLASGKPITGVTAEVINSMNRDHAQENDAVSKEAAIELLAKNSARGSTVENTTGCVRTVRKLGVPGAGAPPPRPPATGATLDTCDVRRS